MSKSGSINKLHCEFDIQEWPVWSLDHDFILYLPFGRTKCQLWGEYISVWTSCRLKHKSHMHIRLIGWLNQPSFSYVLPLSPQNWQSQESCADGAFCSQINRGGVLTLGHCLYWEGSMGCGLLIHQLSWFTTLPTVAMLYHPSSLVLALVSVAVLCCFSGKILLGDHILDLSFLPICRAPEQLYLSWNRGAHPRISRNLCIHLSHVCTSTDTIQTRQ